MNAPASLIESMLILLSAFMATTARTDSVEVSRPFTNFASLPTIPEAAQRPAQSKDRSHHLWDGTVLWTQVSARRAVIGRTSRLRGCCGKRKFLQCSSRLEWHEDQPFDNG